jgi:hypothetical protein
LLILLPARGLSVGRGDAVDERTDDASPQGPRRAN